MDKVLQLRYKQPTVGVHNMTRHPFWYHAPRLCLAVAAATIVGYLGFDLAVPTPPKTTSQAPASALSDIPLTSESGQATSLAAFKGSWLVVFFGYASCPDVCPTSLAYLARELKLLGRDSAGVKGIFISLDPKRDKPETLSRYVHSFDPSLIALTGSDDNLRRLGKQLGVYATAQPAPKGSPEGAYTMAHTAAFFLVRPDGQLAQTLSPPFEAGALAGVLRAAAQSAAH